jgi:hypothetical protein
MAGGRGWLGVVPWEDGCRKYEEWDNAKRGGGGSKVEEC